MVAVGAAGCQLFFQQTQWIGVMTTHLGYRGIATAMTARGALTRAVKRHGGIVPPQAMMPNGVRRILTNPARNLQRERGMATAIIKFESLPDPVRPAAVPAGGGLRPRRPARFRRDHYDRHERTRGGGSEDPGQGR
jgi:hypothetical protein